MPVPVQRKKKYTDDDRQPVLSWLLLLSLSLEHSEKLATRLIYSEYFWRLLC